MRRNEDLLQLHLEMNNLLIYKLIIWIERVNFGQKFLNHFYNISSWLPCFTRVFIYPNVLSDRKRNELYL
jgi:hypothetical protein